MNCSVELLSLDPHWMINQELVMGLRFECPLHHHQPDGWRLIGVPFTPALDGTPTQSWQKNGALWQRTGETFADLTLTPSIRSPCGFHGFATKGLVTGCDDSV